MTPMTPGGKRLAIALAVSVALNLFLAGFVTMRALYGRRHHERGHHGHFLGPRGLARDGEPEALREVMRRREPAFRAQGERVRASRRAVSAAFESEPFDRAALERALADLRTGTNESQRLLHEALLEAAPSLSPEQRARLAKRALDRGPGLGRGRR